MIPKFLMMDLPPGSPGVLHTKRSVPMSIDIKAKLAATGLGGALDGLKKLF